jgi:hypothetical protein
MSDNGDFLSKKFKALSKGDDDKAKKQTIQNESSDLHIPAAEHRARLKAQVVKSADGGDLRPKRFDPLLAVWIARMMPLYWSPKFTFDQLMEIAKRDGETVRRGAPSYADKARMTVVVDRLNIMKGVFGLESTADAATAGYHELRFVKDLIRFHHLVMTGVGVTP